MSDTPAVVTVEGLVENRETPGIVRRIAFHTDNNVMVEAFVNGGVTSGWHHHGDRHVYAYLLKGEAVLEFGPEGGESLAIKAGDFFHLPPRIVHRDVNPSDEQQHWIINFVGAGKMVEHVEGPDRASSSPPSR